MKNKKEITEAEILRLAMAMCGISVSTQLADLTLAIVKGMKQHGESFSILHATRIQFENERRYRRIEIKTSKKGNQTP